MAGLGLTRATHLPVTVTLFSTLSTWLLRPAQSMDSTLLKIFGKTCALVITGALPSNDTGGTMQCIDASASHVVTDSVFGDAYVVSLGFVVVMCLTIPIGFFNLDDNIWVQVGCGYVCVALVVEGCLWKHTTVIAFSAVVPIRSRQPVSLAALEPAFLYCSRCDNVVVHGSCALCCVVTEQVGGFIGLAVCLLLWLIQFLVLGLEPSRLPATGSGYGSVLSVVVFNFGFIMTIPSWLNEKKPEVDASKTVWISVIMSLIVFLALGIIGAMAIDFPNGQDLLQVIDMSDRTSVR